MLMDSLNVKIEIIHYSIAQSRNKIDSEMPYFVHSIVSFLKPAEALYENICKIEK